VKTFDEQHLIELLKQDPHTAFKRIIEEYQDRIFNLCIYMLHSREDAQEAAQDVFIKAYRSFKNFTPRASLYTWLYRISINTCIDYKRRHQEDFVADDEATTKIASPEPSPEKLSESKEATTVVQKALESMTPDFKAVFVLREMEGLSYEEIAEVLQISIGTVKSRISRARDELRQLLRDKL
jgi:RNA polymerase sigma-70 factor (ECF subfamily)